MKPSTNGITRPAIRSTFSLWTPDTDVSEFFALEPDVYAHYYEESEGPVNREWSPEERAEVVARWRAKLGPHIPLGEAWIRYLATPALQCFKDERENELDEVYAKAAPLSATDLAATRSTRPLSDIVRAWLAGGNARPLLVVGDP
jgi:hypothetical protein